MSNLKTSYSNDKADHKGPSNHNAYDSSYSNSVQTSAESSNTNRKSNYLKFLENSKPKNNTEYNFADVNSRGAHLDEQTKTQLYKY